MEKAYHMMCDAVEEKGAFKQSDIVVNGDTLIRCGLKPGPIFSEILNDLFIKVVDGDLPNSEMDLMMYVMRMYPDLEFVKETKKKSSKHKEKKYMFAHMYKIDRYRKDDNHIDNVWYIVDTIPRHKTEKKITREISYVYKQKEQVVFSLVKVYKIPDIGLGIFSTNYIDDYIEKYGAELIYTTNEKKE